MKTKEEKDMVDALRLCHKYQKKEDALANCSRAADIIERLIEERDAAVRDISNATPCFACRHFYRNSGDCPGGQKCFDDAYTAYIETRKYTGKYFEWRGIVEENKEERE